MSQRISPQTLYVLRNDLRINSVIQVLEIPWKKDDMKFRFICPQCHGLDTSTHSKTNLGRCFSCQKNFNTIDMVMVKKGYAFRQAVDWLLIIKKTLGTDDGQSLLTRLALRTRIN